MNLLDRHIFKSALFSCLAAVSVFVFVLVTVNIARELVGPSLTGQLTPAELGHLTLLLIPLGLTYGLPMGILTGVLLTLGRLSADSEITAMRACGISLLRIARPILILGLLGAAVALPVNFEYMPRTRFEYDKELTAALRANPVSLIEPKTFIREFPGYVAYVGEKKGTDLRDFWLWQLDKENRVVRFIRAASGHLDYDEANNELILTLQHAQVENRAEKDPEDFSEPLPIASFASVEPTHLSLDKIFGRTSARQKPDWMTWGELHREEARLAAQTVPADQRKVHAQAEMKIAMTVQNKINTAFAALAFAFMAIPLGIKVSRRETSANLAVAVLLALGYYFLGAMVGWLDRHPEYRPDLLLWAPNTIFFCLGTWLFFRIGKKRT